ncbi:hypothetical protein ALI144C_23265 [Actinosynnema sp. ALI-1.44]|nr:hypothetical protein ALI144C_23265 [Actinosynnema sp. ALI-1.44]
MGGVTGAGVPAAATQSGSGGRGDLFQTQTRLIAAADLIKGAGGDGYAGIALSPQSRELTLYWKGTLSAGVARAVDQARREVGVRVLPAANSERELLAVAERLAAEPGVTSVGPKVDGSGVTLGYAGDAAIAQARPAIRDVGVAVEVRRGEYARMTSQRIPPVSCVPVVGYSRQNDACPYGGGATFTFAAGGGTGRCTTGWPVKWTSPFTGNVSEWLLTAGHCGSDGLVVNTGGGRRIGTVEHDDDNRDTMLIRSDAMSAMYVGKWNSSVFKPVRMPIGNYVNTLVCTSGAMSGQNCDLRIDAVNVRINVQDNGTIRSVFPMVSAWSDKQTTAVAQGDSGGPVAAQDSYSPVTGGGIVYVYAAGTITAGNSPVPCPPGSVAQSNTTCFKHVFYAPLQESLARYNVTVMT